MSNTFWKIIKFGVTGAVGMLIDFGVTWLCREKLKWNKYIANTTGFSLAATNNFIINRNWTFKSVNPNWHLEFEKFLVFSLIGLALNNLFVFLFNDPLKKDKVLKFLQDSHASCFFLFNSICYLQQHNYFTKYSFLYLAQNNFKSIKYSSKLYLINYDYYDC